MLWEVCNMCNMEGEHLQTRPVEQLQQAVSFLSSLPFPPQQRETKGVFPKETGFENSQVFPAIFCCWNSKVKSCHGLPCFIKTATIPHCFVVGHIHRFCGAILGIFFLWEREIVSRLYPLFLLGKCRRKEQFLWIFTILVDFCWDFAYTFGWFVHLIFSSANHVEKDHPNSFVLLWFLLVIFFVATLFPFLAPEK